MSEETATAKENIWNKKITLPPPREKVDISKVQLYTLLPGEEVIFELQIDQAQRSGGDVTSFLTNLFLFLLSLIRSTPIVGDIINYIFRDRRGGVFVITNMRCLVCLLTTTGCTKKEKQRVVWSFPQKSLNESVAYEKSFSRKCLVCIKTHFTIEVGLTVGNERDWLKLGINQNNIKTDEEALAIVAKIAEIGQQAQK